MSPEVRNRHPPCEVAGTDRTCLSRAKQSIGHAGVLPTVTSARAPPVAASQDAVLSSPSAQSVAGDPPS